MFETIVVRTDIDAGHLAEILLFYQKAHLLLQRGTLASLLTAIGPDNLLELVRNGHLRISFLRMNFVTMTRTESLIDIHDFGNVQLHGTSERRRISGTEDIELVFKRIISDPAAAKLTFKRLIPHISFHKLEDKQFGVRGIPGLADSDLDDSAYVVDAVSQVLANLVPEYRLPSPLEFNIIRMNIGFFVDTNLSLVEINTLYHRRVSPQHSSITTAFLLDHLLQARADVYFSSTFMSEFVASRISTEIIKRKQFEFIRRRLNSEEQTQLFQETTLGSGRALREAINSGAHSFEDFLPVLEKAARFKQWLVDRNPDENLIADYHRAATEATWLDKLPSKGVRFSFATGLGLAAETLFPSGVGTTMGLGVGSFDTFVLDRLLRGWRPSHFIEGPLKTFVGHHRGV